MRRLLLLAALALTGCATREFYLQPSEAPWEAQGMSTVAVAGFQAEPASWTLADKARQTIVNALDKGTVRVVAPDPKVATLQGAVSRFSQLSSPASPRRILRSTGSTGSVALGAIGATDVYAWEMDVSHSVQLTLVIRIQTAGGNAVWSKEAVGQATETQAVALNWPGSDPMPPPAQLTTPPDPALLERLRERALAQALDPLVAALTVRYAYRVVP